FAIAASMYSWGDAFLFVTSRYADGFPQTWTVLDPERTTVGRDDRGGRTYRVGPTYPPAHDVLQITPNPTGELRGTPALQGYAGNVASASAAAEFSADVFARGGIPWATLQPTRGKLTEQQAADIQAQWVARAGERGGAPAVLDPDLVLKEFQL